MANTPAFDLDAFGNTPMNCMTLIAGKAASATGHVPNFKTFIFRFVF